MRKSAGPQSKHFVMCSLLIHRRERFVQCEMKQTGIVVTVDKNFLSILLLISAIS